MGLISLGGNRTTIITGINRRTGVAEVQMNKEDWGTVTGGVFELQETMEILTKKYPHLEFEYEVWKD